MCVCNCARVCSHHSLPVCHYLESDHEAQMYQIQALIDKLPEVNKETLKRVIGHLRKYVYTTYYGCFYV